MTVPAAPLQATVVAGAWEDGEVFTGIIEEVGTVAARDDGHIVIEAAEVLGSTRVGDSIAVNGCCLTVTELGPGSWAAEAVEETRIRTTVGDLCPGDRVNLERPCQPNGRLGGHIVQGHVDGVATVRSVEPLFTVELPTDLARYVVEKGSIAIDGVSLTVAAVDGTLAGVALIPHTREVTVLGSRQPGDRVNIEVDVVAKYVEKLLGAYMAGQEGQL